MDEVSPFEPTVVGAVAQHWRLILLVVLLVVVPAGFFAVSQPKSYTATASLAIGDPTGPGTLGGAALADPARYVADQLVVFRSAALGDAARKRALTQKPPLVEPATWFSSHAKASATADASNVVSVSFSAASAAKAMAGIRAVVDGYGDVVKAAQAAESNGVLAQVNSSIKTIDTQVNALLPRQADPNVANQITQLTTSRAALVTRRDQIAGEASFPSSGVGQALLPGHATTSGKSAVLRVLLLAIALGGLIGVGLAYTRSYRKRVFTHSRDPELLLGAPLLVDISGMRTIDLLGLAPEKDFERVELIAEEKFAIAVSVVVDQRFEKRSGGLSLAIVTAQNGASCTAVAWRSALALTAQGLRVLLIDVDGSWPPAGSWMNRVTDHVGWIERTDGSVALGDPRPTRRSGRLAVGERAAFARPSATSTPGSSAFYFCGEPPPVRSQKALREVFRELEDSFDIVLVNAPPFLPSAEAGYLTAAAGAAMVVVPDGGSVTDYEELVRRLRVAAATPIGYVYCCAGCDVPSPHPGPANRLRHALHAAPRYGAPVLPQVAGLEGSRLTTEGR